MRINAITYNSAISALAKAARSESRQQRRFDYNKEDETDHAQNSDILWRRALDLIECMEKEGVKRDVFTYSAAISTCGAAGRWQETVNLINTMKSDGGRDTKPNRVSYTSAISEFGVLELSVETRCFVPNVVHYLDLQLPVGTAGNGMLHTSSSMK
jgi:pentatricopeptide repeat protein